MKFPTPLSLCGTTLLHALAIGMVATSVALVHSWIRPIELYWQPVAHVPPTGEQSSNTQPMQPNPAVTNPAGTGTQSPLGDPLLGPAPTPLEDSGQTPGETRPTIVQPDRLGPMITLAEGKAIFDLGLYPWVDARLRSQYEEERILAAYHLHAGGLNTPEGAGTLFDLMPFKDDHIIVYCDSPTCDAAENLARELQKIGFHKLHIMHEGIQGWKAAGYPTEKGPPQ